MEIQKDTGQEILDKLKEISKKIDEMIKEKNNES